MALQKTIQGIGDADASYHLINEGSLVKDLDSNTYKIHFALVGYKDKDTRDNKPEVGPLSHKQFSKNITEAEMGKIISDLELYDYVKANDSDMSSATDV